jgi:Nitroreductase family
MAGPTVTDPWSVASGPLPADGSSRDRLVFALRCAILAPSGHNTQPWRFRLADDRIELHADRVRALPIVDPAGREVVESCGAALFFMRLALQRLGVSPETTVLPAGEQQDLLALVSLGGEHEPTTEELAMFDAIPRRHTNRHAFDPDPVPEVLIDELTSCAAAEGVWLEAVGDEPGRHALAGLIADANRIQLADHAFRGELASWIRAPGAGDGMTSHGVPLSEVGDSLQAFFRTFDSGGQVAQDERQLALGSPLLVVLGSQADDSRAWLSSGQALARVLLTATAAGLSASFLNQPIQVPSHRPLVAEAIGRSGHPQQLLRLGIGPPATPTPRRPLEAVLI